MKFTLGTSAASQNQLSIYTSASTSSNQLLISSTSNSASIQLNNGITSNAFIGIGCSNLTGNYSNNMFLETTNSIVLNTGGINASSTTPDMIISSNGYVGMGVNIPIQQLHVQGTSPAMIRVSTNYSAELQVAGIEFGIPAFSSTGTAKILSTARTGNVADLQFYTTAGSGTTSRMTIMGNGNVGIGLTNPSTELQVNGTMNATTINENGTALTSKYLQLAGGTMTGGITLTTTTGNNPIYITSTITNANNCLQIKNNSTYTAYIGVGGTAFGGNYANNLFLESSVSGSAMIFNTGGNTSASIPRMMISSTGNIGIATDNPGTNILQIGGAGRLKIGNGTADYTLIGTLDTDSATNTRIVLSGNTRSGFAGNIDYVVTAGSHIWYTSGPTEQMRMLNSGNLGIGTNNPGTKLEIYNATNPKIFLNTAGTMKSFLSGTSTGLDLGNETSTGIIRFMPNNSEAARIDATGKMGIGTNNPVSLFHIKGSNPILSVTAQGGSGVKSQLDLSTYLTTTNTASCSLIATDNGSGGNSFQINLKTSGDVNNAQFTPFYISPTGFIGIGTNSSTSLFHLHQPTTSTDVKIQLSDATTGSSNTGGCAIIKSGSTQIMYIQNYQVADLYFSTAGSNIINNCFGSERLRIIYNGNVGIGTTNPKSLLELYSTTQTLQRLILSGQEYYQAANTSTDGIGFVLGVNRSNNRQLYITDSSNLSTVNSTNGYFRIFINSPSFGIDCFATDGTRLPMSVGGSMTILGNGNVGIGTANPLYNLDCRGSINGTSLSLTSGDISLVRNITSSGLISTSSNLTVSGNISTIGSGSSITTSNLVVSANTSSLTFTEGGNLLSNKYQSNLQISLVSSQSSTRQYPPTSLTSNTTIVSSQLMVGWW